MELIPPTDSSWSTDFLNGLTDAQKHWLVRPNALTDGLRTLGELHLEVLDEYEAASDSSESWMVGSPSSPCRLWVREIVMSLNDIPAVAARSLCPLPASQGEWARIRGLSSRPLADLLYSDSRVTRSNFFHVDASKSSHLTRLCHTAFDIASVPEGEYLVRASRFLRGGEPLIVMECFAPAFWDHFV
ncbi:chorismate lyase [Paenalcaligenes niemegkensis]|uniref:chorismate--pyruvate lyase family protein n=1 Tax=Paenalcaligenes niemegkensis TaxID=2895469 RepID=UPI001EE93FC5|nr:chorismate lyase [Paenalcaligenes niemegkensis]MCQ9616250.1 chorismate lyase [Paenalcaligenes niemegkensis]